MALHQEDCRKSLIQNEHRWLEKWVGLWSYELEASSEPGKPPQKMAGTELVRSLGGLWIIAEAHSEPTASRVDNSVMTLGFDRAKE